MIVKNNNRYKAVILGIAVLLLLVICVYFYKFGFKKTPNAQLEGQIFDVRTKISGMVSEVNVSEDSIISMNYELVKLDDAPYKAEFERTGAALMSLKQGIPAASPSEVKSLESWEERLTQAEKNELGAEKEVEKLSISLARVTLARRKAEAAHKTKEFRRLMEEETAARQALESVKQKQEKYNNAKSRAKSDLAAIKEQVAEQSTPEGMREALEGQMAEAEKRLDDLRKDLESTTILSPADGYVLKVYATKNSNLQAGDRVLQIVPLDIKYLWVRAFFSPAEAVKIKEGDFCKIVFTELPDLVLKGYVVSLKPVVESVAGQGNNTLPLSRREGVPVKIMLDNYDINSMPLLRLGMGATVTME